MIWPSKKVLSAFILVGALVASIIIAFGKDKSSEAINFASDLVAGEKASIPPNPSWQNELDRTTANTEIIEGGVASTTETTTDLISKSLMANYLALKQSGNLDELSAQKLIEQSLFLINRGDKFDLNTKLNIIPDNGKQTIIQYGEDLGNVFRENKPNELKNEFEVITKSIEAKDKEQIEELVDIIIVYQMLENDLEKMSVPKTFAKAHLDLINSIKAIASSLTELREVFNDPVRGLAAIQLYSEGVGIFAQVRQAIISYIIKNEVVYKQGSGGFYLFYGI